QYHHENYAEFTSGSMRLATAEAGTEITPFFLDNKTHDLATAEPPGRGKYAIAAIKGYVINSKGNIALIPFDTYKAAGLPMHEKAPLPPQAPATPAPPSVPALSLADPVTQS